MLSLLSNVKGSLNLDRDDGNSLSLPISILTTSNQVTVSMHSTIPMRPQITDT